TCALPIYPRHHRRLPARLTHDRRCRSLRRRRATGHGQDKRRGQRCKPRAAPARHPRRPRISHHPTFVPCPTKTVSRPAASTWSRESPPATVPPTEGSPPPFSANPPLPNTHPARATARPSRRPTADDTSHRTSVPQPTSRQTVHTTARYTGVFVEMRLTHGPALATFHETALMGVIMQGGASACSGACTHESSTSREAPYALDLMLQRLPA